MTNDACLPPAPRENRAVAETLIEVADLLEAQRADPYRSRAYRKAAESVQNVSTSVRAILVNEGRPGLDRLPYIGPRIAAAIDELLHTGRLRLLDRLRGELGAERLLRTVPGVGPRLAQSIHEQLGINTLEELEIAAHDGRLARLHGIGARRIAAFRHELASMLAAKRSGHRFNSESPQPEAPVELLLSIDTEYRVKADAGSLRTIAPRRFNPEGKRWLPIWHVTRDGWEITAMFSNTARAHRLEKTRDWVVIFYERDGCPRQCTVVTEHRAQAHGHRVVRGRESDCATYYARKPKAAA